MKLNTDRPGSRWILFPTWQLRKLWLDRYGSVYRYINLWEEAPTDRITPLYGLHAAIDAAYINNHRFDNWTDRHPRRPLP